MKQQLLLWLFFFATYSLYAQPEKPLTQYQLIQYYRYELQESFLQVKPAEAVALLDTLRWLEDDQYLTTQWDERWLLYFWSENYETLLNEVARFSNAREEANAEKIPPPEDSLFILVDGALYNEREQLFARIQESALSLEDRTFAALLLDYLLRLSAKEPYASTFDAELSDFQTRYPKSRYARFLRKRMYNTRPPGKWALGVDVLFSQDNWTDNLEYNFRTGYGGDFGLAFWRKRLNLFLRIPVAGQKLMHPVVAQNFVWEEDESSVFFGVEAEAGYDLINKPRFRIFPTVGGGFSSIHPPAASEENPNPDYYDFFRFNGGHLSAAIHADVKFKSTDEKDIAASYHGVRVRVGYRWLNLGRKNPALQGNMFFFAVGYTIFGRQTQI